MTLARSQSMTWLREIAWVYEYIQRHYVGLFLPARRYASTGNSDRNVSVRPSVTSRYCVKTTKASVMISSPSGSPTILVFWCQISSQSSKEFPPSESLKQGWGGKIQSFSSFKRQYLENGRRYVQSYYYWLIGSRRWAFDWHQGRWPWMTLNCYKFEFSWNFTRFRTFGRQQRLNDPYCQRQNCSPLNVLFIDV